MKLKRIVDQSSNGAVNKKRKTEGEGDSTSDANAASTYRSLPPTLDGERAQAELTQASDSDRQVQLIHSSHSVSERWTKLTQTSDSERQAALTQSLDCLRVAEIASAQLAGDRQCHCQQSSPERRAEKQMVNESLEYERTLQLFKLVLHKQWEKALPLIKAPLRSCHFVNVLKLAADNGQWAWIQEAVRLKLPSEDMWSDMAPLMDQWVTTEHWHCLLSSQLFGRSTSQDKRMIVFSLRQWCLMTGHANLAFFLAVVSRDVPTAEMLARTSETSLHPHRSLLREAVRTATDLNMYSAGAAILRLCQLDEDGIAMFYHADQKEFSMPLGCREALSSACEKEKLLEWAVVLQADNMNYLVANLLTPTMPTPSVVVVRFCREITRQWLDRMRTRARMATMWCTRGCKEREACGPM